MAVVVSDAAVNDPSQSRLTIQSALRYAWRAWLALWLFPFLVFLAVSWSLVDLTVSRDSSFAGAWFVGTIAYMVVFVTAAVFWRSHLFKPYWKGQPVPPRAYLTGMMAVWISLEIAGILSLIGCYLSGSMLPGLIPAMVAFVLFTVLWPSGRAMTRPVGNSEDPSVYEEPR